MIDRDDRIQVLRGSSSTWAAKDPVLLEGEHGLEKDTGRFKVGDGNSKWSELEYFLPESYIRLAIQETIDNLPEGGGDNGIVLQALTAHINSLTPHPVYDEGPEFLLYYLNAKV